MASKMKFSAPTWISLTLFTHICILACMEGGKSKPLYRPTPIATTPFFHALDNVPTEWRIHTTILESKKDI
jgi:hypothetical protein